MSILSKAFSDKQFDVRMIERGLSKDPTWQKDVEKHKTKIADDSDNAAYVNLDEFFEGISVQTGLRKTH